MDWARAIETNQAAPSRIVAALIAALGLAGSGAVARLPKPLYYAALWVLRPVEAAVRRLIVIAARGLKVMHALARPMPKGLMLAGKGEGRLSFQLFDPCKRFDWVGWEKDAKAEPRNHVFDASPLSPLAQPRPAKAGLDGRVDATRLLCRLAAVKLALETLSAQAKRLARWKARRARMEGFIFRSPLRPGPPPGYRKKGKEELDQVLAECHGLAWEALREDTS